MQPIHISAISNVDKSSSRFNVGDRVRWFRVPTQDFGTVIDRVYGSEGSVQVLGWHYLVQLDTHSPSFAHCKTDYGFEEDLALLEKNQCD
ncbi:hypothetical protein ACQ4M3_38865 [Leptolyngbya sp. AN03gr2]|uniref:hypothetical protein n=1 Tax=unclassified Leptolyngbya TaxID=2650499 RepID=UPI003D30F659